MSGLPLSAPHSPIVAQTVFSVGPYALKTRRPEAQRATSSAGHASPAITRLRSAGSSKGGQDRQHRRR